MRFPVCGLLVALAGSVLLAQTFPPGFVDPAPMLAAAAREIGEANLKCITFSGTGYGGAVGQAFESAVNVDWPRIDSLANYTRTINFEARTIKEEFDRKPGLNPASWKYGLGWQDGTPLQKNVHQTFVVNGNYRVAHGRRRRAAGGDVAEDVERGQLEIWMNPHGFLKAARLPGANPKAVWRWELGEMGRDGPTTVPEKVHVVSITMGKYRIDATINSGTRFSASTRWFRSRRSATSTTSTSRPISRRSARSSGRRRGTRTRAGTTTSASTTSAPGTTRSAGTFADRPAQRLRRGHRRCRTAVRQATGSTPQVTVEKLATGVYLLGGGPANSVAVEFKNYVAVFEAPTSEARSLAVIEQIVKLMPNKPIRYLINSHQHFDHIGGIRTYLHIGATIVTQRKNIAFLNHDVLNYRARTVVPDMVTLWPPTEVAEGYNYESVNENYVDHRRLAHPAGLLRAAAPARRGHGSWRTCRRRKSCCRPTSSTRTNRRRPRRRRR